MDQTRLKMMMFGLEIEATFLRKKCRRILWVSGETAALPDFVQLEIWIILDTIVTGIMWKQFSLKKQLLYQVH